MKYYERFNLHSLPIVLLSHALLETHINAIVQIGLSVTGKGDIFEMFDKQDLRKKWLHGPKLFIERPNIDPGDEKFSRLAKLISIRNTITHYKPAVMLHGNKINKGSKPFGLPIDAIGARQVLAFSLLPDQLFSYVMSFISNDELSFALNAARPRHKIKHQV